MIVSGGENVFPSEVEDLLAGAAGVAEVAVVGVPDNEFGQRLRAYVVPRAGRQPERGRAQRPRSHRAWPATRRPREIVFVDELPRNATGKILKRQLHD